MQIALVAALQVAEFHSEGSLHLRNRARNLYRALCGAGLRNGQPVRLGEFGDFLEISRIRTQGLDGLFATYGRRVAAKDGVEARLRPGPAAHQDGRACRLRGRGIGAVLGASRPHRAARLQGYAIAFHVVPAAMGLPMRAFTRAAPLGLPNPVQAFQLMPAL